VERAKLGRGVESLARAKRKEKGLVRRTILLARGGGSGRGNHVVVVFGGWSVGTPGN
jgi:hypothetical protein